jgi:predicted ATPase/class 3 adenylate cyclase/DNA-binding CsgD family transcriptional regulator
MEESKEVENPYREKEHLRGGATVADREGQTVQTGQLSTNTPPMGTITLLFTDIEGSTRLLQQMGSRYTNVLNECRHLLRTAFQQWSGHEVDTQGDAFFAAFARATDAVEAAVAAQRAMAIYQWPEGIVVRVRMGLHTGEPERSSEGYVGLDVHLAARLMSAAHGRQVLLSGTTQELAKHDLPEGVSLRDLGLYHLKDFPRPKRIFQLIVADLPADFPPLRIPDTQFNNLPAQLTSLIGREQEVVAIRALLQRTDVRLVTLTGTGGIGKTRLSHEVATALLDIFVDGVCFVPLASISDPAMVVPTIAHLLGLEPIHTGPQPATIHMEYLKTFLHDKHFLLLLDNFEQIVPAALALVELLSICPHLKMLVTSRAVLHVQGEHEFAVPPLAFPKRTQLPVLEELPQYAAVALFLERALAIKPDFALTKANLQAIAAICVHLDGLPLAIELAAARMKLFPPRALLERLTHRLAVLTGGTRNAPLRQQTLRNTLAWSYNLLDAEEQRLFRHFSVFVGGCTLEAIESIMATFEKSAVGVMDGAASLIDKSLLQQIEQEEEESRLIMLETIREYGLECLAASGEMEAIQYAHAAYYLALVEEAEPERVGTQQTVWLQRLEREHDNLRAALGWMLERAEMGRWVGREKEQAEQALRLCGALFWFWYVRGYFREGQTFLKRALAVREGVVAPVRAKALQAQAELGFLLGDIKEIEILCEESLALFRELGDKHGMATALHMLGAVALARSNYATARQLFEEAMVLFQEVDDIWRKARALAQLGRIFTHQGEYARARSLLEESLVHFRALGDKNRIGYSLYLLARVLFLAQDDPARARALAEESLPFFRQVGAEWLASYALSLMGQLALHEGDVTRARELAEESVMLFRKIGHRQGTSESLSLLAQVVAAQGDYMAAQAFYEQSLTQAMEGDDRARIASSLEGLASMVTAQREPIWAARLWGAAEYLRETINVPLPPIERADYERLVMTVREQLGESVFAATWAQGRIMTPEQVLAMQGQEMASAPTTTIASPAPAYPAGLTAREVGVLRLVAGGLTNSEIAEELGLSEKTIAHHLTHIFNKTTSENRAAAAAFAIRHGLA